MIDKEYIFAEAGLKKEVINGSTYFLGADGKYYYLDISDMRVNILRSNNPIEVAKKMIGVFRIYSDEDMCTIVTSCLKSMIEDMDAYMSTYNSPVYQKIFIRGTLGKKVGKQQIENLCILFYETVRIGDPSLNFSECIKDVLKIHAMPISDGILPELHDLLLKVPDVYYDFVLRMERRIERRLDLQKRCIEFLKARPETKSKDLIIYTSMLLADATYYDRWADRVINLVDSDDTFAIYDVKHGINEIIRFDNKHDWHIFDVFLDNKKSYTFRQVKSLVFADYRDITFRGAMVSKVGDDLAMIFDIAEAKIIDNDVYEGLIKYLEKLVQAADVHNLIAFVQPKDIELYERIGFELSEDELVDNPYDLTAERAFMWKKLPKSIYES